MRFAVGGVLAAFVVAGLGAGSGISPVRAQTAPVAVEAAPAVTVDTLRRRLLDACVVEIWRRPEMTQIRTTAVARCQCASTKAVKEVSEADAAAVSYGQPLVGAARDAVFAALQGCSG